MEETGNFFRDKLILAPMVRVNKLPFRLLALHYGAELVYTEEIIDYKLLNSERIQNDALGTVDYVDKADGSLTFQTCSLEKDKVIIQIGTNNPERAALVAKKVEQDVAGVDINMGCPKHFSLSGNMGAALLTKVTTATEIVSQVRAAVNVPVTCKIRLLEDPESTAQFCRALSESGVYAVAVHGRTVSERPRHPNRNDQIRQLVNDVPITFIANGDSNNITNREDIEKFRKNTNCNSVMIARAAQQNCSIFRNEMLPVDTVITEYLKLAIDYDSSFSIMKYCVQSMLRNLLETPIGKQLLASASRLEICDIWNLRAYFQQKQGVGISLPYQLWIENAQKKRKTESSDKLSLCAAFIRCHYKTNESLPKYVLHLHSRKCKVKQPVYKTVHFMKLFQSTVFYDGKKYTSSFWQKNKRFAEQSAAIVCLTYLKIYDINQLKEDGIIRSL